MYAEAGGGAGVAGGARGPPCGLLRHLPDWGAGGAQGAGDSVFG